MKIKFDKVNVNSSSIICPTRLVNLNKAGNVYLVKHKSKTEEKENNYDKATHFSLTIDVTGSSTSDEFIATHVDPRGKRRYFNTSENNLKYSGVLECHRFPLGSSTLNCQIVTRSGIEYLGYEFPPDVKIISDCIPTMVNIDMKSSLLTARAKEKSYDL